MFAWLDTLFAHNTPTAMAVFAGLLIVAALIAGAYDQAKRDGK